MGPEPVAMARILAIAVVLILVARGTPATHRHSGAPARELVEVREVCPAVQVELRYATARNLLRRAVYPPGARCLLRPAVAQRLCRVQRRLERQGIGIKVWDAYRPRSVQSALWEILPDSRFVAPPWRGSIHNRGAAVDVTLVTKAGRELPMPTDFDEATEAASPTYRGGSAATRRNRDRLRRAMLAEGFVPEAEEWWHFNAPEWKRYPLLDVPLERPGYREKDHE